jgi:hypothetical protein
VALLSDSRLSCTAALDMEAARLWYILLYISPGLDCVWGQAVARLYRAWGDTLSLPRTTHQLHSMAPDLTHRQTQQCQEPPLHTGYCQAAYGHVDL